MYEKKPNAVIVELCEDRFISIAMDAQLKPRLNNTLLSIFESRKEQLLKKYAKELQLNEEQTAEYMKSSNIIRPKRSLAQNIASTLRFAKGQAC